MKAYWFPLVVLLVGIGWLVRPFSLMAGETQPMPDQTGSTDPISLAGPELDGVPGPAVDLAGLPPAATWPAMRYEHPLRLLAILDKRESAAPYQRIARRLHASLELRYIAVGDDRYHVNDKWIEPSDHPTMEELIAQSKKTVVESIEFAGDKRPYDVIFCRHGLDDRALQEKLVRFLKAGGVVVVCGSVYPASTTPLGGLWPAKATGHNSWTQGGAQRLAAPELAGVPLQYLGGHDWIPLAEPAGGATALSRGESGAMFSRRIGDGALLFVPSGPISRRYDSIAAFSRKFDHDDIWLRAWDQVLHSLVPGTEGFPAYADLRPGPAQATLEQEYVLPAKIVNLQHRNSLCFTVHVTTPQGKVVYAREEKIDVAPGREKTFEVRIRIPAHWGSGIYPVYLTLGDPSTKKQLHQAMELIPVAGLLDLSLHSEKRGYKLGDDVRLILTASAKVPWKGSLRLGVYDFRGRLLAMEEKAVQLGREKQRVSFTWRLVDHGVRVDTYWAQIEAVAMEKTFGRAEARFFKYEPWSMRNEYQWSTWASMACASPSLVPMGMRLMAHAGMNALGYPGRSELYYAAERWGWRYYNEGIGMSTFAPLIEYENEAEIESALTREAQRPWRILIFFPQPLCSAPWVKRRVSRTVGARATTGIRRWPPKRPAKPFGGFCDRNIPSWPALMRSGKLGIDPGTKSS